MKRVTVRSLMVIALSLFFLHGIVASSSATIIPYTNEGAWESAVGSFLVEDFEDTILNPGISISSDFGGSIGGGGYPGKWYDRVSSTTSPVMETTFSFTPEILAFGGTWDLAGPGGQGENIDVTISLYSSGTLVDAGTISRSTANTFWGFTSTNSFTDVVLAGGGGAGWCETYTLDNMKYTSIPDPAAVFLLGSACLIGFAGLRRKFKK